MILPVMPALSCGKSAATASGCRRMQPRLWKWKTLSGEIVPCRPYPGALRPIQYSPSGLSGHGGTLLRTIWPSRAISSCIDFGMSQIGFFSSTAMKGALHRGPARAAETHRIRCGKLTSAKEEQHPLREIDDDAVAQRLRDDVGMVHSEPIARQDLIGIGDAVALRQRVRRYAVARADLLEIVARQDFIIRCAARERRRSITLCAQSRQESARPTARQANEARRCGGAWHEKVIMWTECAVETSSAQLNCERSRINAQ